MTIQMHSKGEATQHDSFSLALTHAEKDFFTNFWHETLDLELGPALNWLREHGIEEREIWPFTTQFQKEFGLDGAPRQDRCLIPWTSAEEFRSRSKELSSLMNDQT